MKKYQFIIIAGFLLAVAGVFYFFDPSRLVLFPRCPFYVVTGYYCPGCGSQRAIHSFLHFRWIEVIHFNLLVFPAVLLIVYHFIRKPLKRKFGLVLPDLLYMKRTPWIIMLVIISFWIARNLPYQSFAWLRPAF